MIEIIFTRPLTIYNSSEPINSALFSRVKPSRSPRLVKLNSFNFDWKRCTTSKGFRALFTSWYDVSYAMAGLGFGGENQLKITHSLC